MKTAIITGANRGIGKTISFALANLGYKTLLFGRNQSDLAKVAKEIKNNYPQSPQADIFCCDLLDEIEVQDCLDRVIDNFESIDILVNNAGVYIKGSIENEVQDFNDLLRVNLVTPFQFMKAIAPIMIRQQSGYIFNIASRAGKFGFEGSGFYSASKFGLLGMNESLYRELTKSGIKVTAICPGWVNTDMAHNASSPIGPEKMIEPEDLAKSISFFLGLSPNAIIKELIIESPDSIA